jgi:hypothetical protein
MQDKLALIDEIKEIYLSHNIEKLEIDERLLEYLELKDLQNLKAKVLQSLSMLTNEQKEWLKQFKKDI